MPTEGARLSAPAPRAPIRRIVVGVHVGTDRMAATDDPLFLELLGPGGREFRLEFVHGRALRRGALDRFVLGGPGDSETNVANPELNDPNDPPIDANGIIAAAVRKGLDPIPNVRGRGEMDDRVQLVAVEVELHVEGEPVPRRWRREGSLWLGLVCGMRMSLSPVVGER